MSWLVSRRSSSLALRFGRRTYAKICTKEVVTGFDMAWRGMGKEERDKTIKDYAVYESQDWHTLSLEQKRASTLFKLSFADPELCAASLYDCLRTTRGCGPLRGIQGVWRSYGGHGWRDWRVCVCSLQMFHLSPVVGLVN